MLTIESKIEKESELREITNKLKKQTNELDLSSLDDCGYEECRDVFKQVQYYIDGNNILDKLSGIVESKKIEKYPELLRPTYYPEIDSLDIPDSEKLRLDKATRRNIRNYMSKSNIKKLTYPLTIDDLELLRSVGIVEREYNFRCKNCGSSCTIISEKDLKKYKRFWGLFELEKRNRLQTNS